MSDAYRDFQELAEHQTEGEDFEVEWKSRGSGVLFMTPHGGGIEPGTTPLVKAAAGSEYSYYCFNGIKKRRGNWCLHVTSTRFDEPRALQAVEQAEHVIAIHGAADRKENWVMVGGRDHTLASRVEDELEEREFAVRPCKSSMSAESTENICNKGPTGGGVQLELSRGLRDHLSTTPDAKRQFVQALRAAVPEQRDDNG